MWTYHPDLLAGPVPRYTSYPTAMEFTGDVGAAHYARALDAIDLFRTRLGVRIELGVSLLLALTHRELTQLLEEQLEDGGCSSKPGYRFRNIYHCQI